MKEFPKIINLYNRYREKTYLEQIESNKYQIICNKWIRIGYHSGTSVEDMSNTFGYDFIDPSGGPFMQVGHELDTYNETDKFVINKIYSEKFNDKEYRLIAEIDFKE